MPEEEQVKTEENVQVKKILDEDKNKVVDQNEINRIFRIYLGRIPSGEETSRFEGIKESEFKILEDYVSSQRETTKNEEKMAGDSNKIQGDLMLKGMKAVGNNNLEAMKTGQPQMPMPVNVPAPAQMPTQTAPAQPTGGRMIPEGRFSLMQFKG